MSKPSEIASKRDRAAPSPANRQGVDAPSPDGQPEGTGWSRATPAFLIKQFFFHGFLRPGAAIRDFVRDKAAVAIKKTLLLALKKWTKVLPLAMSVLLLTIAVLDWLPWVAHRRVWEFLSPTLRGYRAAIHQPLPDPSYAKKVHFLGLLEYRLSERRKSRSKTEDPKTQERLEGFLAQNKEPVEADEFGFGFDSIRLASRSIDERLRKRFISRFGPWKTWGLPRELELTDAENYRQLIRDHATSIHDLTALSMAIQDGVKGGRLTKLKFALADAVGHSQSSGPRHFSSTIRFDSSRHGRVETTDPELIREMSQTGVYNHWGVRDVRSIPEDSNLGSFLLVEDQFQLKKVRKTWKAIGDIHGYQPAHDQVSLLAISEYLKSLPPLFRAITAAKTLLKDDLVSLLSKPSCWSIPGWLPTHGTMLLVGNQLGDRYFYTLFSVQLDKGHGANHVSMLALIPGHPDFVPLFWNAGAVQTITCETVTTTDGALVVWNPLFIPADRSADFGEPPAPDSSNPSSENPS